MAAIDFKQRRVLVTGAGRGIGRAIVDFLDTCNAKIVAVDLEQETLNKLKHDVGVLFLFISLFSSRN